MREPVAARAAAAGCLALLLAATFVAAVTFDPRRWPQPVGDESTYLMAAQSLAWDLDLRYSVADLRRFREQRGEDPDGLILQSADRGKTLLYAKPLWYSLYLAPFARLAGLRGPAVANALLLAAAAIACALALRPVAGAAAPLWSAVFLFASVTFSQVFWAHADLFQMTLVALALALVVAPRERPVSWTRWLVAGLLLGGATAQRPVYVVVPVAVALALALGRSWRHAVPVLGGLVVIAAVTVGIDVVHRGAWTSYGAERQGFYGYTGFPGEPGAATWEQRLAGRAPASWVGGNLLPYELDPRAQARNAIYFALGRHVGALPYFLPIVLGLAALRPSRLSVLLLLAVAGAALAFSIVRPYNFWGGGGALANRYFLPIYPVFWYLGFALERREGPIRVRASRLPPVLAWTLPCVIAALAAPALWPLWKAPRQFLRAADGGYGYVSPLIQRLLPYETTQTHLKPGGREDFVLEAGGAGGALWVKPLSPRIRPIGGDGGAAASALEVLPGPSPAQVLLGSPRALEAIEIGGGKLGFGAEERRWETRLPLEPTAVHSMWWTPEPYFLYRLDLERVARRAGADPSDVSWVVRVVAIAT